MVDERGDVLRPPHGTKPAAVKSNIKSEMRSFKKLRARLGARKTGLSPPVFLYWPFQGGTSVVVPYCSCCLCLYFGSSIMLVTYFVILGSWMTT